MAAKTTPKRVEVKLLQKHKSFEEDTSGHWKDCSRRIWIFGMFLGTMLLYSARSAVPLCIAAMSRDLSWDKLTDSAVMSAFFWGYTPAQIAGGYLSDRYGGELVLGYAGILWSICTILVPFLPAGPVLFFPPIVVIVLSRVLTGLSQGVHYPSLTNIIVKRIPLTERSFMTSSVFSAGTVGTLLMGSAGSFILIYFGWRNVFIIQGFVGLLWAWIWLHYSILTYSKTSNSKPEKLKTNGDKIGGVKLSESTKTKSASISVPYGLFFRNIGVWALILGQFAQSGAFWNLFSWLPLYFEEEFPGSKKWVYNVLPWIVSFPTATISGLTADHMIKTGFSTTFVRKLLNTISMGGGCLCMILFDWVTTFEHALVLVMVTMVFNGIGNCGIPTTPQDMAPKFAGSLFGLMNAAGAFSGIVIVPISGHLLEITLSWKSVFHINAIILLTGSLIFLIFGTAKKIV